MSAFPGLAGFTFVSIIAPMFYAIFLLNVYAGGNGVQSEDQFQAMTSEWFGGCFVWLVFMVFVVVYPASRGKLWALKLLRILSIVGIIALAGAIAGDFIFWKVSSSNRGLALFLCIPLALLAAAAGLLINGLLHQPWFDPSVSPDQIGPSGGTIGDYNKQANLGASGRPSPEQLTDTLATPAPPPRWLCYVAPPIAAARMRRWWHFAIFTPLCLAALALAVFMPIRAIFVYALMGTFADRLRSLEAYRKALAEAQNAEPPSPISKPSLPKTRHKTASK